MSHFCVLVVTKENPLNNEAVLEQAMAPYHEYECTGIRDQYVVEIDITTQALAEYEKDYETAILTPSGEHTSPYDVEGDYKPEFCKVVNTHGFDEREMFVPEGYTKTRMPAKEFKTFSEWAAGYYGYPIASTGKFGYIQINDQGTVLKVVKITNPNDKWDWWMIGGRYTGHLIATGLNDKNDVMLKKQVDVDSILLREIEKSTSLWQEIDARVSRFRKDYIPFQTLKQQYGDEFIKDLYWCQDFVKAIPSKYFLSYYHIDKLALSLDEYVESQKIQALTTFAILKDGVWTQRGDMGWFGSHSEEHQDWNKTFMEIYNSIPDDHYISVVDCHI